MKTHVVTGVMLTLAVLNIISSTVYLVHNNRSASVIDGIGAAMFAAIAGAQFTKKKSEPGFRGPDGR
jgi:hypothetical protein